MYPSAFTVSRFLHPKAVTFWRVDGRIQGLSIRKNFKTRAGASAEKASLEAKAAQTETGIRTALTRTPELVGSIWRKLRRSD
jgi:hypothetical protein